MPEELTRLSRRRLLGGGLAAGAALGLPVAHAGPAAGSDAAPVPLYAEDYQNWSTEISLPGLLTCAPEDRHQLVACVNWAHRHGYLVRPRGSRHGWSPLTVGPDQTARPVLLVDTTQHLTRTTREGDRVRVETGTSLEALLRALQTWGRGFTAYPVVGEPTVGGMLAIDAHGCAVRPIGAAALPGQTYGSISNRVLEVTAVVWDTTTSAFALRTYPRTDPRCAALLVSLGRAFLVEVVMATEPLQHLRCRSYVGIPAAELLAAPGSTGRTFSRFLDTAGSVDMIWFPYSSRPWLKVWQAAPTKPLLSRKVTSPYNYPFSDNIPDAVADLAASLVAGNAAATPLFGRLMYDVTVTGLAATAAYDLWGASKDVLLWLKPTTLREHRCSWAVHTRRGDVQGVLHAFHAEYTRILAASAQARDWSFNMPVELRVTGLDHPGELGAGARGASLSALLPHPAHPEYDTAVWLSVASLPGSVGRTRWLRELEQALLRRFTGQLGLIRPEWSKGWAYGTEGAWEDDTVMARFARTFPAASGQPGWNATVRQLDALDPHGVFGTGLTDRLLVTR